MWPLRELQQSFAASMLAECETAIHDLIAADRIPRAERLRIYRNTFRANLTRTLRMVYPAVDRLVGPEFFDAAAEAFSAGHAPQSGDLNAYGAEFADFLAAFTPASSLAYLRDVARFEWALNVAANADDAPVLHPYQLAAIDPEQHALLSFTPHPSVSLLALDYPADHIADAVLSGDDAAMAQIDLARRLVHLVVHRGAQGVEAQRLDSDAFDFVARLYAAEPLGVLLEDAPANAPLLLADELTKARLSGVHIAAKPQLKEHPDERR